MVEGLAPSGYMRYAPDGTSKLLNFGSGDLMLGLIYRSLYFLLFCLGIPPKSNFGLQSINKRLFIEPLFQLLRPEFSSLLVKEEETEIFDLIGRLIQTLSSPKIAIDDRHTPKLYARFLAGLLSRHRRDGATVGRLQTNPPPSTHITDTTQTAVTQTPPVPSHASGTGQSMDQSFSQTSTKTNQAMDAPVDVPEATFSTSAATEIQFDADYEMSFGGTVFSEEEMLATMQAIKNPAWWQNMMMPG